MLQKVGIVIIFFGILFSSVSCEWEIINEVSDVEEQENFLQLEEFIPVDPVAKDAAKKSKRTLSSVNSTPKTNSAKENDAHKDASTTTAPIPKSVELKDGAPSKTGNTLQSSSPEKPYSSDVKTAKASSAPEGKEHVSDDKVDLVGEGFLLMDEKVKSPVRRLAEVSDTTLEAAGDIVTSTKDGEIARSDANNNSLATIENSPNKDRPAADKLDGKTKSVPELRFNDEDEDIFKLACRDPASWECLMFKEDYIAMKKDWNLSDHAIAKLRNKRQSGNNNNADTTESPAKGTTQTSTDYSVDTGSGLGQLYKNTEFVNANVTISQTTMYRKNATLNIDNKEKERIKKDLEVKLNELLKNLTGFLNVDVNNITITPSGEVEVQYKINFNGSDPGFLSANLSSLLDKLLGELQKINGTFNKFQIDGLETESPFNRTQFEDEFKKLLEDPCLANPCSPGYHNCIKWQYFEVRCTHKCVGYNCTHGECELDTNFEPVCSCPSNWEGPACELKVSRQLDSGQITGVTIGAIALTVGLLGCCFWFLACRKSDRDIAFTHYSDEEGSSRFSNPSSKLSAFVIDRPKISINPIQVFRPTNDSSAPTSSRASFGRRSSVGTLTSDNALQAKTEYPQSKA